METAAQRQKNRREFLDSEWVASEERKGRRVRPEDRRFCEIYMGLMEPLYPDEQDVRFVLDEFIEKGLPALRRYDAETTAAHGRATAGSSPRTSMRPRICGKALARRLRRLDDVAQLVVPFASLAQGTLEWGDRPISWPHIAARLHPSHPDSNKLGEALERAFRRDRRDPRLQKLYFDSEFRDWAKRADYLRPILRWLELSGRRPEDLFVRSATFDSSKLSGSLPPEIAEAFARAGWPREGLVVSAKYPSELVQSRQVVVRGKGTANREARQQPMLLLCNGRVCDSVSRMLIWWSPAATVIVRTPQCGGCAVASRMMSKLPSG